MSHFVRVNNNNNNKNIIMITIINNKKKKIIIERVLSLIGADEVRMTVT